MGTFNSLYLGFFHASPHNIVNYEQHGEDFQFPLLGIFPCILLATAMKTPHIDLNFQFPLLGIFPCIMLVELAFS